MVFDGVADGLRKTASTRRASTTRCPWGCTKQRAGSARRRRDCIDRRWSSLRDDAEAAAAARNQMEGARHGGAFACSQGVARVRGGCDGHGGGGAVPQRRAEASRIQASRRRRRTWDLAPSRKNKEWSSAAMEFLPLRTYRKCRGARAEEADHGVEKGAEHMGSERHGRRGRLHARHGRKLAWASAMGELLRGVRIRGGGARSHGRRRAGEGAGLGAGLRKKTWAPWRGRESSSLRSACCNREEERDREK
jgi:hypothetical protein